MFSSAQIFQLNQRWSQQKPTILWFCHIPELQRTWSVQNSTKCSETWWTGLELDQYWCWLELVKLSQTPTDMEQHSSYRLSGKRGIEMTRFITFLSHWASLTSTITPLPNRLFIDTLWTFELLGWTNLIFCSHLRQTHYLPTKMEFNKVFREILQEWLLPFGAESLNNKFGWLAPKLNVSLLN